MRSQFQLNNSIGSDISVTAITVEDNRLVGYIPQELKDGGYTVNWPPTAIGCFTLTLISGLLINDDEPSSRTD